MLFGFNQPLSKIPQVDKNLMKWELLEALFPDLSNVPESVDDCPLPRFVSPGIPNNVVKTS